MSAVNIAWGVLFGKWAFQIWSFFGVTMVTGPESCWSPFPPPFSLLHAHSSLFLLSDTTAFLLTSAVGCTQNHDSSPRRFTGFAARQHRSCGKGMLW